MTITIETGTYITYAYFIIGIVILSLCKGEIIPTAAKQIKQEVETNFTEDDLIEMMWLVAIFLWLPAILFVIGKRIYKALK